jgi:hypothetical protein
LLLIFCSADALARDVLAFMCAFHAARECVPLCRFVVRQFVAILKLNLGDDAHAAIADLSDRRARAPRSICRAASRNS